MFDPRSILDAIVKGTGEPQARAGGARNDDLGSIGDLLKQIAGGDGAQASPTSGRRTAAPPPTEQEAPDAAMPEEDEPQRRPRTRATKRKDAEGDEEAAPGAPGGGLEDIIRDVLGGKGGGGLKDILDKVNQKGGLGDVLGPVLGQIFGQKGGGTRLADVPEGAGAVGSGDALADRIKALAGGRSPEELMAAVKQLIAENKFGAGMAAGGLGALVLGTRTGRSLAASAAKLGGLAVIGGLAYKAYTNYQQGATATPDSLAHQRLVAPPAGSGFEAATVSQDLATTMLKAMVAAAAADGRIDPAEHEKLVAGFGGESMPQAARDFLAREIAAPASIEAIAAEVTSEEAAVQVFTAARITVDPDNVDEHTFLQDLAAALGHDDGLVAHIDAAARGGA
jgi:uncharacterized membrane protein YebE (DUF533 family)